MTKERFVYLLNFIEKRSNDCANFCDALEKLTPGCYCDAFIYADYETELVKTIKEAMGIPEANDDIEYFMYELNFGKDYKPGMITVTGKNLDFSTAEKLYDYLAEHFNGK